MKVFVTFLLLWPLMKCSKHAKKAYDYILKDLWFNQILTIMIDGYMEILVSGYLSFKEPIMTKSGEYISYGTGIYVTILALVILPIVLIWSLYQPKDVIESEEFLNRWGRVFEDVRSTSKYHLLYTGMFMMRRLIFVSIAFGI